jgi:hypothetical protein
VEPTEAQYVVLNALETLGLLAGMFYDQDKGFWYITTPSLVLPTALYYKMAKLPPISWASEL